MINYLIKDFKLIINTKKIVISFIFFAIIFLLFSSLFSNFMTEKRLLDKVTIGIIDEDNTFLSKQLINNFKNNDKFNSLFEFKENSKKNLLEKYNDNSLSAIITIPKNYTDSLKHYENQPIKMILNPNFPLKNTILKSIMSSYSTYIKSVDIATYSLYSSLKQEGLNKTDLDQVNQLFSINMVGTALNRNSIFDYKPIYTYPSSNSKEYFIFSIIILSIIFISSSGSSLLNEEITTFCIQRLLTSGRNVYALILSKILVMVLNIFLTIIPFIFIMYFLNSTIELISLVNILMITICTIFFFTTFSLFLGVLINKHKMNMLISSLLTLTLGIIGGNFIPIQLMPKYMQDISSFTPNYWILRSYLYSSSNINNSSIILLTLIGSIIILLAILSLLIQRRFLWKK